MKLLPDNMDLTFFFVGLFVYKIRFHVNQITVSIVKIYL